MTLKLNHIAAFLVVATLWSCKEVAKEKTLTAYEFSEKGIVVNCDNFDLKLLNEALFAFEDDISKHYGKTNPNLTRAYSQFLRDATYKRAKFAEIATPHTFKIAEVLKSKTNLWNSSALNYKHPIVGCIGDNLTNKDLKTTLNALIKTNSMSTKLYGPAVQSHYSLATKDKYLAIYIALDFYYANLLNIDPTTVKPAETTKVDFNKTPQ
jgi:hypothetical protein